MNGYGSHTYMWINAVGEKFWVKHHFHRNQGMAFFSNAEAARVAGQEPNFTAVPRSMQSPVAITRSGRCSSRACPTWNPTPPIHDSASATLRQVDNTRSDEPEPIAQKSKLIKALNQGDHTRQS